MAACVANAAAAHAAPQVAVVTFGPGDEAFARFGHDALLVTDPDAPSARRQLVYNYGTFSFASPLVAVDFLKGGLNYWLSVSSLQRTIDAYRSYNRSVRVQDLALPADVALRTKAFVENNARPENRAYRYDYYQDNCATRIRDIVDTALGGELKRQSQNDTGLTYRDHTRRLTESWPLLYFGLDLALGPAVDHSLTEWESMFLPEMLERKLTGLQLPDGAAAVTGARTLFEARRDSLPERPTKVGLGWALGGALLGSLLTALGWSTSRGPRILFAAVLSTLTVVAGLAGALMTGLWLATDHAVTYGNRNILLCLPLWLIVPAFTRDLARPVPRSQAPLTVATIAIAGATLALVLQLVPGAVQQSGPALGLLLPLWAGAWLGLRRRYGRSLWPARPRTSPLSA